MSTAITEPMTAPASRGIRYPFPIQRDLYKWPTFTDAEFARRHAIVRKFMDDRDLDCLLITGNNSIWVQPVDGSGCLPGPAR